MLSGFCLLSNVAIGAAHAMAVRGIDKGIKKVAIVDWDVHHGGASSSSSRDTQVEAVLLGTSALCAMLVPCSSIWRVSLFCVLRLLVSLPARLLTRLHCAFASAHRQRHRGSCAQPRPLQAQ
eukprot:1052790-Rhodomonas_salina.3